MGTVKLAAALPKLPELNGLMDRSRDMLAAPKDEVIIVVRASVKIIHEGQWDGTRIPELGILSAEVATGADADEAKAIMDRAKDRRYARRKLPMDGPGMLGETDRARYGAAGLLKHGSGLFTGRADPDTDEDGDE